MAQQVPLVLPVSQALPVPLALPVHVVQMAQRAPLELLAVMVWAFPLA
jgi:hypothetical protein